MVSGHVASLRLSCCCCYLGLPLLGFRVRAENEDVGDRGFIRRDLLGIFEHGRGSFRVETAYTSVALILGLFTAGAID